LRRFDRSDQKVMFFDQKSIKIEQKSSFQSKSIKNHLFEQN